MGSRRMQPAHGAWIVLGVCATPAPCILPPSRYQPRGLEPSTVYQARISLPSTVRAVIVALHR